MEKEHICYKNYKNKTMEPQGDYEIYRKSAKKGKGRLMTTPRTVRFENASLLQTESHKRPSNASNGGPDLSLQCSIDAMVRNQQNSEDKQAKFIVLLFGNSVLSDAIQGHAGVGKIGSLAYMEQQWYVVPKSEAFLKHPSTIDILFSFHFSHNLNILHGQLHLKSHDHIFKIDPTLFLFLQKEVDSRICRVQYSAFKTLLDSELLEEQNSKLNILSFILFQIMTTVHSSESCAPQGYCGVTAYDEHLPKKGENSAVPEDPLSFLVSSFSGTEPGHHQSHAVHPLYAGLRERLDSFALWPGTHAQDPRDLAVAGFFYTGHADCVRCHYCDLALKHWDLNHRPLEEHACHSPSCGYVQILCRDDFISNVQVLYRNIGRKEHLDRIPESAGESSTGKEMEVPPSETPGRRPRFPRPNQSLCPVKCLDRVVSVWFPRCGHFVPCRECAPPHSRCPACPSTKPSGARLVTYLVDSQRNAEGKPADEMQADRTDTTRPAAAERDARESIRPSSDQLQSDSDPPLDLRATRLQRDAMEISALLDEDSCRETKTGDTESAGNQDGNGQDIMSLDVALEKALYFSSNMDVSIHGTKTVKGEAALLYEIKLICVKPSADRYQDPFVDLHQTKPIPILENDRRSESNPLVPEHAPRFPTANPDASHGQHETDDANEALEEQSPGTPSPSQQTVQDVRQAIQEATRGFKHPVIHQMLSEWRPLLHEITALPMVPQSTEQGLARVDFRSPDRERMHVEGFRVGTFLLYPRAEEHAVLRLANAGFYYTGRGDTLACFCCDVTFTYADRRPGENPYDIHRQLNPNCPHLMGGETRNVFIQDEQTRATSSRDIISEGNESDEPNIPLSQLIAEAIARIRSAVSPLYRTAAVPNAASQNQRYLLSTETENVAQINNNTTHGTNRSFEEPRPGQNSHDPLIQTISSAYENSTPASPEGRMMGEGNNERPRQDDRLFPQSGNPSGQQNPASVYQTFQAGVNGRILSPPSINTQESSRPLNEPIRSPVPPQPSAQVHDTFQRSSSNPQPPVSAPSTSPAARQGEASPANPAAAVSDYDPSRAVHAQYTDLQRRQNSYGRWPDTHAQSPEELAVAGFFFTGVGDCVRCHYCGLGLKHWDPDDRPLDEHVRWRSSCGYLRALCGDDVIYRTLARLGGGRNGEAAPAPSGREAIVAAAIAPPPTPGMADNGSQQNAAARDDVADLMTSEAAVAASGMGFTSDAIARAITALLGTRAGRRAVTAQNLVNAIIYLQARGRDSQSPEASDNDTSDDDDDDSGDDSGRRGDNHDDNTPPPGSPSPSNSGNAGPSSIGVVVRRSGEGPEGSGLQAVSVQPRNGHRLPSQISRQTLRQLEQENQELRDRRRCKICLDNDVSILFLPCGHLVCCAECAPALRRCPMCRRRVTGTVRTHLAPLPASNAT